MAESERKQYKFGFTNRDSVSEIPKSVVQRTEAGKVMVTSVAIGCTDMGKEDSLNAKSNITNAPSPRYHSKTNGNRAGSPAIITVQAASSDDRRKFSSESYNSPREVSRSPVGPPESNSIPPSRQLDEMMDNARKGQLQQHEKTISIQKTRLIDGPNKLVRRKPLFYKHSSEEAPFVTYRDPLAKARLHISEYIRTVYRECEEDKDAMNITFQAALSRIQDSDHLAVKSFPKQLAQASPGALLTQLGLPVSKCEVIDIREPVSNSRNNNDRNRNPTDNIKDGLLVVAPAITNSFTKHRVMKPGIQQEREAENGKVSPSMRGKASDFSVLSSGPTALLRKTWRLAVSRLPQKTDPSQLATDVFISGTNIHPIIEHPKIKSTNEVEIKSSKSPSGSVELLKLSHPIFQYSTDQTVPNASHQCPWQDQEPLMAFGRPKSVNTRSSRRSVDSASSDRHKRRGHEGDRADTKNYQRYGGTPRLCDQSDMNLDHDPKDSEAGGGIKSPSCLEEDEAYVSNFDTDSSQETLLTSKRTDLSIKDPENTAVDQNNKIPARKGLTRTLNSESHSVGDSVAESDPENGPLRGAGEPTLRQSKHSAKMQGVSSDMREAGTCAETTVQKPETGVRHKVLKPMFDKYDYEDFQHKKYQSFNRRNNKRSPSDPNAVHYLRVNIGDQ